MQAPKLSLRHSSWDKKCQLKKLHAPVLEPKMPDRVSVSSHAHAWERKARCGISVILRQVSIIPRARGTPQTERYDVYGKYRFPCARLYVPPASRMLRRIWQMSVTRACTWDTASKTLQRVRRPQIRKVSRRSRTRRRVRQVSVGCARGKSQFPRARTHYGSGKQNAATCTVSVGHTRAET